jgi:hypothetical protein
MTTPDSKKRKHEEEPVETVDEEQATNTPPKKKQKVVPPLTSEEFKKDAKGIQISIAGKNIEAKPVVSQTGSFGWVSSGSHSVVVGEKVVQVQFRVNITVPGSNTKKNKKKSK